MNKTIDLKQSDYDIITKIPELLKNNEIYRDIYELQKKGADE